jgi:N utilization substance protein B
MKLTRSQKREGAFLLMYQSTLNDDSLDEIVQANIEQFEMTEDADVVATAQAALANVAAADEIINRYSPTRKVERIAKIPLVILRLALYEIDCLSEEEMPDKAAINEAIELCKKYSGEGASNSDTKFVSGLLGSYYRSRNGETQSDGEPHEKT